MLKKNKHWKQFYSTQKKMYWSGAINFFPTVCPDGFESGVVEKNLVVQTQGRTSVKNPVEAAGF